MPDSRPLYIPHAGPHLIDTPLLNKGSAFPKHERDIFNLSGLLPPRYESIEEQVDRCYMQYQSFPDAMNRHIYLRALQDTNETLFYRLLRDHIAEMMPIIYTPTVGDACEKFSRIYRRARGLFIAYEDRDQVDDILRNATKRNVKVIVVTDGERILGLGDQGLGGMGIPIGKLSLYTACGGVSPAYTLPVMLDVGTNNDSLLQDPMYMGTRHRRIEGEAYQAFVDVFIQAAKRRWPGVLIQFEDFAQPNAMPLLERFRHEACCFNDDIQGTAAVTAGTLLAACRANGTKLSDQTFVFVGAGSAGCGIAAHVIDHMESEGLSREQAQAQIFMVDRLGLVTKQTPGLRDFQRRLAQTRTAIKDWSYLGEYPSLAEVVKLAKPTVLVGVSGQPGIFTREVVQSMREYIDRPIILPLSNPSRQVEALPADVIEWTDGNVLVATGSPFDSVLHGGKSYDVPQCNNSYVFPGIGLGVIASNATRISDNMLIAASRALADTSPLANTGSGGLLPPLCEMEQISKTIAFAVATAAQGDGFALERSEESLRSEIDRHFWKPRYRSYRRVAT